VRETGAHRIRLICILGPALISAVLFGPTIRFDFTNWDDHEYVVKNSVLVSGNLSQALSPKTTTAGAWTPVTSLTYSLERAVFGLEPAGYHATNVALHATCSGLVALLLLETGLTPAAAFVGATLFGVHPVQVESVAWISGRKNLVSTLLLLLAVLAFRRPTRSGAILGNLLGGLALLAKPTAVILVPLALLDRWRSPGRSWAEILRGVVPLLPLLGAALAVGLLAMEQQAESRELIGSEPALGRLLTMGWVTLAYLRRGFWPTDLAAYYPVTPVTSWSLAGCSGLAAVLVLLGGAAWFVRKDRRALFLLAWVPIAAFPHANLIAGPYWMADRYVYVPLVGAAGLAGLATSALLAKTRGARRTGVFVVVALALLGASVLSLQRAQVWRSSLALWEDTLAKAPGFALGHLNRGTALADEGRLQEAAEAYRRSLELKPGDANALSSLANMLHGQGREEEAFALYERAIASDPDNFAAYYNRAIVLQEMGQLRRAMRDYQQALALAPGSWTAWNNLGNAYVQLGRLEKGIDAYRQALEANPSYAPALANQGDALRRLGRRDEAESAYRRAVQLDSNLVTARYGLAVLAAARGDLSAARSQLLRVLELDPELEVAHRSLARVEEQLRTAGARP
jgi:tetratricopeptide (TPR) repeat protein